MLQIAVEAGLVPGPVRQLVECDVVEMVGALERAEGRQRDEVLARHIVGFAMALTNVGTRAAQKLVGETIARVGITHAYWLASSDAVGKSVALINIEDSVLA